MVPKTPGETERQLDRYLWRKRTSVALDSLGIIASACGVYLAITWIIGSFLFTSEQWQRAVPTTVARPGDLLFWFLSRETIVQHPRGTLAIVGGLFMFGLLSLCVSRLISPDRGKQQS